MNLVDLIVAQAKTLRSGEETPVEADWPAGREELWLLLAEAETLAKAAGRVVAAAKQQLAATIQTNEKVRLGPTVYDVAPTRSFSITDPLAFIEWLGDDWEHVIPVTSHTRVRVGGLKAVCQRRGVDYWTVRNTFFQADEGEPALRGVPVERAPKYAQKLGHNESTFGRASGSST